MHDVAMSAGVSLKTVSRVINGEAGVARATAERVTLAVDALGFQRNDIARSLRHGVSSATLGLVIEDVANPFYSAIAQAVEAAAHRRGLLLITTSCQEDPVLEREFVTALLRRRVDALLIVPAGRDHRYLLPSRGTPTVFLDRPPGGLDADVVLSDDEGGARAAVAHLLAHGHRRIGFVAERADTHTMSERRRGYESALRREGIVPDPELVRMGSRDPMEAEEAVKALLALASERRPTALLTANNRMTVGALRALRGRIAPLALVGYDDLELGDLLATPVTTVRHDATRMGAEAAALAFARLDGDAAAPRKIVLPTELVARGSGELRPPNSITTREG